MKECIAMLLAGGQGSRLYALTQRLAKPAVPFGGKYRIIDFPLSNCVNSGIDTVGILTQYQPLVLNEYIGNGQPWDLDRLYGGVHVLPPYQTATGSDWYKGTANAIYQNINFIERYEPEYVVILSGDHIYKMDYSKMLEFHKAHNADCTIAVMEVPWEEASRFGIMTADEEGTITRFQEKPKNPESNLASMGIYIFTWTKLRKYLAEDEADPASDNDFGKNIIPNMLAANEHMVAYPFEGYWKDVGTIDSLWEANMDLLDPNVALNVGDDDWRIYSRNSGMPGHYIGTDADVQNSMITEGCQVHGKVEKSVLFAGVKVGAGAVVEESIVMPGAVIEEGAHVSYAIVAENVVVKKDAVVGCTKEQAEEPDKWGIAVIGEGVTIGVGAKVGPKAMVVKNVEDGDNQW
ncbi:MAG TPA: glucose-1-phosphate adenylyltransferase [Candidatus Anaerofilum excrementigallinarum]|nr:glucose-1-phosphate adenylyltransferase [Candidatus Anaerofilum excrementigallinarum]